ncbi:MAG: hypothetical protein ABEH47_05725 [Haloferacaceae archaeon]
MGEQERETLREELPDRVDVVRVLENRPARNTEWYAICEKDEEVWCIEKTRTDESRGHVAVYEGEETERRGYQRQQFVDVFSSVEKAVECVADRA